MKAHFFVSALLLIGLKGISQSNAASKTTPSVQFGIKAGVNISKLTNSGPENYDYRTNFHAGGLAHIHLNSVLAVQPEIVYSRQGAEYSGGIDKLDYINIPVLLQYMRNGFRLETGPQASFLTAAKFENRSNNSETDIKNAIENFDFAWTFGVGYLSNSGLGVDARFNLGLKDIAKDISENKQRVWQFGVFYQFPY